MENSLKRWRKMASLTQQQLADRLPKISSYQTIQKWERWASAPHPALWEQLANILHVTKDDIYNFAQEVEAVRDGKPIEPAYVIEHNTQHAGGNAILSGGSVTLADGLQLTEAEERAIQLARTFGLTDEDWSRIEEYIFKEFRK